jgi:hypothetical protein
MRRGTQRRDPALQQAQLARVGDHRGAIAYVELRNNPMQIPLRVRGRRANAQSGKVTATRRRRRDELTTARTCFSTAREVNALDNSNCCRDVRLQRPMWPKRRRRTSLGVNVGAPLQNVIYPKLCAATPRNNRVVMVASRRDYNAEALRLRVRSAMRSLPSPTQWFADLQ